MALVGDRRRHHGLKLDLPPTTSRVAGSSLLYPNHPSTSSDYERLSVLGHGNDGTVYKVRNRHTSSIFALKLSHHQPDSSARRQAYREIAALRRAADSPFVVRCHAVLASADAPALVLEYMDAGDLGSVLRRRGRVPELAIREIARQILLGLSHLHARKVVHRDLKPSNLLVNGRGEIKISDFGVSRVMARSLDPCDSYVGTCAYMSPERFDPETYGAKYDGYAADVWSLGVTVMELFLGRFPLLAQGERPDWATLMCAICFGDTPSFPEDSAASPELRSFVECCVYKEAGKRWTVAELLRHPFVNGRGMDGSREAFLELVQVETADS